MKVGKNVEVTFANPDFIPHNIVFVEPNSADKIGTTAIELGADGFAKGFVPNGKRILIAFGLVDNVQEEVLEFTAPSKPGDYEFV